LTEEVPPRFLLYSHDGMGLGHTRRNLAIARALAGTSPGAAILLATGTDGVASLGIPEGVEILKMPGLRKVANGRYVSRRLTVPEADIRDLRKQLLESVVLSYSPTVMLVDKHPLGVGGELRAALEALRAMGGMAILGLRDILDEPTAVWDEWGREGLLEDTLQYYYRVLVYGQQEIFDPTTEYRLPEALVERTKFCGYVLNEPGTGAGERGCSPPWGASGGNKPVVLATAGGGEDGFRLLEAFIKASMGAPWKGWVVAGPNAPGTDFNALRELGEAAEVSVTRFVAGLDGWLTSIGGLVCMGGYNTLVEAVSRGTPTVCVPRTSPRLEQSIRAEAFERLGLIRTITPDRLDSRTLRWEVTKALTMSRGDLLSRATTLLDLNGAATAAAELVALARVALLAGESGEGVTQEVLPS
jgi:predicted glycosyltransferase